jgi:hypothetical protein
MRRLAMAAGFAAAGCAGPVHPIYEYEVSYAPNVPTPTAITSDLNAYASQICGSAGYDVLDQVFVGDYGPSYVRIRFACA